MRAVRFFEHGDTDVIRNVDFPVPEIQGDDVLVRVPATSLSMRDVD